MGLAYLVRIAHYGFLYHNHHHNRKRFIMLRFVYSAPVTLTKDTPTNTGWYILYGSIQDNNGNHMAHIAGEFVELIWLDGILNVYLGGEIGGVPVKNIRAISWIGPFPMLDTDGNFIQKIGI